MLVATGWTAAHLTDYLGAGRYDQGRSGPQLWRTLQI